MDSLFNKTITVYVELLEEGSVAWRPTQAVDLGNGLFHLLATPDYDPEDEVWEFLPGAHVRLVEKTLSSGNVLVVVKAE